MCACTRMLITRLHVSGKLASEKTKILSCFYFSWREKEKRERKGKCVSPYVCTEDQTGLLALSRCLHLRKVLFTPPLPPSSFQSNCVARFLSHNSDRLRDDKWPLNAVRAATVIRRAEI